MKSLGHLLLRGAQWFDESMVRRLARYDGPPMTRAQATILAHLEADGSRSSGLARQLGVSRQAVHQTVRELEKLGLVRQVVDERNRSAKLVRWTKKGESSVFAARKVFVDLEWELAMALGPVTVQGLRTALEADWGEPGVGKGAPSF